MPLIKDDMLSGLEKIRKTIKDLPEQLGAEAEAFFKSNFQAQGWQGDNGLVAWPQRKYDLSSRFILIGKDSGHLRKGIRKFVTGKTITVKVTGVATKYADVHNFGGEIKVAVTEKMRRWFWYMYKRTGKELYKHMAMKKGNTMTIHMPQRQFIGNSKQLDTKLLLLVEDRLKWATGTN